MSQMERLYWLDAQLRARRYPKPESLSRQFEKSERTAHDDIRFLRERLHAPIAWDRERGGWFYTNTTFVLPHLLLTDREVAALHRSLLAAREFGGAGDSEALRLLSETLGEHLPGLPQNSRESVGGRVPLTQTALVRPELYEDCRIAVERRHRLHLRYYSAHNDEETERTVRPYHLRHFRGEPYLIAWCELRNDFRDFFLGRIRDWQLLDPDAAFLQEPSFDIDEYLARGFETRHGEPLIRVRVRFTSYQARWIRERQYHSSQQIEQQPDGGLILTLQVAGTDEIRRWILSFGAQAEVLEPESLRAVVAAEAKKLQEIYDPPRH